MPIAHTFVWDSMLFVSYTLMMNILMYAVLRVPAEVVGMCRFYTSLTWIVWTVCWPVKLKLKLVEWTGCLSSRSPHWHIAPRYLGPFTRVADLPSRRSLRSVSTNRLVVPTSRLSTVGSRAFPVTDPQTWNDLPEDVTSAESLTTFRRLLKKKNVQEVRYDTIRYDTIEEINVDSKAEYTA